MENINNDVNQPGKDIRNEKMTLKQDLGLILACFLLGLLANILFYDKNLGISYPIFALSFYAIFLWRQRDSLTFSFSFGWALTIPIVLLSFTYLIFSNEIFLVLNFMAIPVLILAQTILLSKANRYKWFQAYFLIDILQGMFSRTLSYIFVPFKKLNSLLFKKNEPGKFGNISKVIIGLVISLPLVMVVSALLISADQVFGELVGGIPEYLENINFYEFLVRVFITIFIGTISFSYLWSFAQPRKEEALKPAASSRVLGRIWDPVIIITVLVSINMIYVIFTTIQFAYLFGGVVPFGFTYAEYARRGFFELNLVTMINLIILLSNINLKKDGGNGINLAMKVLNTLLVACTAVMLISAHYRMLMYEEAYGYTYLRILTHLFMAFILVLLTIAMVKVWNEKIALLKAYIITALIAYVVVNYMNIDVIIARNNLNRYQATHKVDAYYLTSLSYDAVPIIVPLLDDADKEIANRVMNGLYNKKERLKYDKSWQSFNISKYRAEKILMKYELKNTHYAGENLN